ncbi:MAG TPA: M36 family metallopeptidase [Polyangiaceae bacterium]|nr:M36 family metallopeptidase [Polyangiaceae bacterium]
MRCWSGSAAVALLAACSSQDDFTQVTPDLPSPDSASTDDADLTALNPGAAAAQPSPVAPPPMAAPSGSAFFWAAPSAADASAAAAPPSVERAARAHLASAASGHRYSAAKVAELGLREVHDTGRGAIIARFERRVEGLEVFGQQLSVVLDRGLHPLASSGDTSGELSTVSKATGAAADFSLSPEQAVIAAVDDVTGIALGSGDLGAPEPSAASYERIELTATALSKLGAPPGTVPARTKRVLFPSASKQLLPAYYVEVDSGRDAESNPRYFAHVVSAADGAILWKRNLTAYEAFSYRVYADDSGLFTPWDGPHGTGVTPHPNGEPVEGFAPAFVPTQTVTLSSLEAVGVTDPWLPDGARETVGNNVDAYLDISPPDGFTLGTDFRGQVSSARVFDAVFDPVADANSDTEQQTAAVTQLFYNLNWFHDWYYPAGFDEASGNAQTSNFGRGGVEGDAIHAEAQDGSGANNANMSTPADGQAPRMQMYLWDFGPSSLTVTGPEGIAGEYETGAAAFAPKRFDIDGPIVRADPPDGCAPLVGDYTGRIVLIDRGGTACGQFAFATKAANAQTAGAVGIIVANVPTSNDPDNPVNPSGTPPFPITIGVLTVDVSDGDRLRAALAEGSSIEGTLFRNSSLRDGDFDNQIVAHEWGHYISNRLVGNSAGLANNLGNGLGEGWGDFHAMLITVRPEDTSAPGNANWEGAYGLGGYASAAFTTDSYYFGVRRFPYSTDLSKNPLTFRHISNDYALPEDVVRAFDSDHTEVHNIGEVWATMLWECYSSLLRDTLGATPRLSFAEARDRMRDYIVAAYKLTPPNPTLLEARDALLATALARDPVDLDRFSRAFARRGAGVFAVAPNRFDATNSGLVESYEAGGALETTIATLLDDVAPVCTPDGILDSGEVGTLRVTFRNIGNAPTGASLASVSASVDGVSFPDGPTIAIPPLPIYGSAEASVQVALDGLSAITPIDFTLQVSDVGAGQPPPKAYGFATNADEVPQRSFADGAESSNVVWTVVSSDPEVPTSGRWDRVALAPTDHLYHCSSSPLAATVDFQSPLLTARPGQSFTVSFRHRYSFESGGGLNFDGGVVEISTDGGVTWTDVGASLAGYNGAITADSGNPIGGREAFVADSPGYPEYTTTVLDFGRQYAGRDVLLRFRVASDNGTGSTGWDVDDIKLTGVAEPPFDAVLPQSESCGDAPPVTFVAP